MSKPSTKSIHKISYQYKNPSLEEKILLFLEEQTKLVLDAFFPKKYPAYSKLGRWMFDLDLKPNEILKKEFKKSIENTLCRLKEKGFIYQEKGGRERIWKLTAAGEKYTKNLYFLENSSKKELPKEDGIVRILVFDIPEKHRGFRNFLRRELISDGYKMLQKSVWIGKRPLPQSLFETIKEYNLITSVHLFEVKEKGTLENLIISEKENI